ncbi:hypothetical protein [Streptomyces sp. NPDC006333]|uniref:hypothetical protein n=1 Tax=Streptomyces sp. NPDC006333 TaxID=3156753 RepID=UPI0033A1DDA1
MTAALSRVDAAADGWEGGQVGGSYSQLKGDHAGVEYLNLGGPYGITYANKEKAHFKAERGYFRTQSLYGR